MLSGFKGSNFCDFFLKKRKEVLDKLWYTLRVNIKGIVSRLFKGRGQSISEELVNAVSALATQNADIEARLKSVETCVNKLERAYYRAKGGDGQSVSDEAPKAPVNPAAVLDNLPPGYGLNPELLKLF